jgi:titin
LLLSLITAGAALYIPGCNAKTLTLSWQDTSENENGFRIYRITGDQKKLIAEVAPNVTRYVDQNAPRDACYVVTAFNAAGESTPTGSACRQTESISR